MTQSTEAACLLQSGAMYPRRIGLKTAKGEDLFAGIKPGGVSLYFGDAPIYHFDLEGRWQRAFVAGVHYLKGLDTSVRSIDREREAGSMVLRRRTLPFGETLDLDASIRSMALDLIDDLDASRLEIQETPARARPFEPEDFRSFLERVAAWDSTAWFAHRERYLGTYGPIPFLPPDCPNALVLQASLGNVAGRAFGRSRPAQSYLRSADEFSEHVRAVKKLVGRRIAQFNQIFLAGADILHLPIDDILKSLSVIRQEFPRIALGIGQEVGWDASRADLKHIHFFIDDFDHTIHKIEDWNALGSADSIRITIGIESGDPAIRSAYGKSWNNETLRDFVRVIRSAGIDLGLVILVGTGGHQEFETHVQGTLTLLDSLPLDRANLITLVDARSLDQTSPADDSRASDDDIVSQVAAFKSWSSAGRPKVVAYNPEKSLV
jgi:hypothetical protein